jgi:CHASE2 domain-containing sensor protein
VALTIRKSKFPTLTACASGLLVTLWLLSAVAGITDDYEVSWVFTVGFLSFLATLELTEGQSKGLQVFLVEVATLFALLCWVILSLGLAPPLPPATFLIGLVLLCMLGAARIGRIVVETRMESVPSKELVEHPAG